MKPGKSLVGIIFAGESGNEAVLFHSGTGRAALPGQCAAVTNRLKAIFCVGLVVLGLILTIPWWALIGWLAFHIADKL